jgi:hypothetical protein
VTRRYSQPIQAQVYCGRPLSFIWRGTCYQVYAILATWHLQDRWWADGGEEGAESDRTYYRLDCSGGLQCDVYFDAAIGVWILDRVHD